jgi:O-antigen ligase
MATQTARLPRRVPTFSFVRRESDLWLALALGGLVGLLIFKLPVESALASAVVGAFVILAFVDTRVAVLALVLVRATIDVTATVPLLSASGSSNVNAAAVMSLLVIGLTFAHVALNRVDLLRIPLVKPFGIFLLISLLGVGVAPDRARAVEEWLRVAGAFALYVIVVDLMATKAEWRWVVRVILLSSIVPLCVGLYQFFTDTGNHDTAGYNRIQGTLVHPSPYGFYLVQILPLAVFFLLYTRSKISRVGLIAMVPLIIFSIYATQTRGAWIGVVVVVAVFMLARARWSLVLLPLAAGALFFAVPSVRARLDSATTGTCVSASYCQSSVLWRQKQWEDTIRIASPAQIATTGAGLAAVDVDLGLNAHNEYLRLLVETGIGGLIAMIILYRSLLGIALRGYREAPTPYQRDLMLAFLMVWAARVVIGLTDNIIIVVLEWYFWAFAAIVVGMSGAYRPAWAHQRVPAAPSPEAEPPPEAAALPA